MVMNIADALAAYRQSAGNVIPGKGGVAEAEGSGFADTLKGFMGEALDSMKEAEKSAALGTAGKANLQEVIIAVSSAELMMQTVVALRDKVISAYQEIIRMPV